MSGIVSPGITLNPPTLGGTQTWTGNDIFNGGITLNVPNVSASPSTLILNRLGASSSGMLIGNNDASSQTPSGGGNVAFETKTAGGTINFQVQIGGTQAQITFADYGVLATAGTGFHRWLEGGTGNGGGFTNQLMQLDNVSSNARVNLWGAATIDSAASWNGSHVPQTGGSLTIGGTNATVVNVGAAATLLNIQTTTVANGGGAAPTVGTIGGSGPATAGQNSWLKVQVAGTTSFIPIWR